MKSRTIVLLIILLLAVTGILYIVKTETLLSKNTGLKGILPESTEKIDRIELIASVDTLQLLRSEAGWSFRDGELLNPESIESLFFTVSNIRLVSIVSSEEVAKQPEFITIRFHQKRKLETEFRFLEYRDRNILYKEGEEQAYLVELPGYDDRTFRKVFSLNPDHYRDHLLLNLLPSEINAVEISPLKGSGFSVSQDVTANIVVRDMNKQEVSVLERKIRLLLSYFNAIRFEEYLPADQVPPGFDPSRPSAEFSVTDFGGVSYSFRIFQWRRSDSEEPDLFKALVLYNDNPQILVVNYTYLDLLIRGLEVYQADE